jgi:protein-tyrosine phosphatase
VIAGTPHVRDDWPTDAGVMEYRVAELTAELEQARIPLQVRRGGEIAVEWLGRLSIEELRRFGLGGNPRYLLVETPYYGWPLELADSLYWLRASGITPVLAHPERNAEVQARPELLARLVDGGALVQITAASLDGRIGKRPQQTARRLVESGIAHLLASDAHNASIREVGMSSAARAVGGRLADWLTYDVPAAILADAPIPPRPQGGRSGAGRLRKLFRASIQTLPLEALPFPSLGTAVPLSTSEFPNRGQVFHRRVSHVLQGARHAQPALEPNRGGRDEPEQVFPTAAAGGRAARGRGGRGQRGENSQGKGSNCPSRPADRDRTPRCERLPARAHARVLRTRNRDGRRLHRARSRLDAGRRARREARVVHPWTFRRENSFLLGDFRRGNPASPYYLAATGDFPAELRLFYKLGVDGVFSDNSDVAVAVRTDVFGGPGKGDNQ